jgi:carboxylate-amine ligase
VPERELIREYLEFIDDVVDELDCRSAIDYIPKMLEHGSGADRQLKVFRETGSLRAVVDYMASETRAGL